MMTNRVIDWIAARALDVEMIDRLGWASSREDGGEIIIIPSFRNGEIVNRKKRYLDNPDRNWGAVSGGIQCAWNEDCLRDESLLGLPLIITEGHFDAAAALQSGFPRTISVPNGAPQPRSEKENEEMDFEENARYAWMREAKDLLTVERCPSIILATDGDGPGHQLLHDLSVQLGVARCKFVTYPKSKAERGRPRCKDLNEVLEDYGQKGVVETIGRAAFLKLDGIYRMSELPPLPPSTVYDIGFEVLANNYKMRLGDFVVITGVPGYGKSSFLNDICCRVAWNHGLRIGWASFEQSPQRDHRRALRSWHSGTRTADQTPEQKQAADDWIDAHHFFIVPDDDDEVSLDWLLDRMEGMVIRHEVHVLVVDPFNELDHKREPGESETDYIGRAIRVLKRFAKKFQIHLIVVAHPAKLQKVNGKYQMPSLYEISGSSHWYNKCDLGIIVHRESADDTIIKIQKSRYHDTIGRPGEVKMQFCLDDRRYRETERMA